MNLRKFSAWGFVALVVVLAVLSFLGNRTLFYMYVGLLIPVAAVHAVLVCAHCTNVHCGFNSKSGDFVFRLSSRPASKDLGYSDLRTALAGIPLLLVLVLPFIAVWQLNAYVFFVVLVSAGGLFVIYQRESCAFCTNNCPNNRNSAYREWKKKKQASSPRH